MTSYDQGNQTIHGEQYNVGRDINYYGLGRDVEFLLGLHLGVEAYQQAVTDRMRAKQIKFVLSCDEYSDQNVELHQAVLEITEGFLGIVGHWYGQILPGYEMSRFHLEVDWACNHWLKQSQQRLRIFRPKLGSLADDELQQQTTAMLPAEQHQLNRACMKKFDQALQQIQRAIRDQWRILHEFKNKEHLAGLAAVECLKWQKSLLGAAESGRHRAAPPVSEVDSADLGRLGRRKQIEHFNGIMGQLSLDEQFDDVPALAFLIAGPPGMGHTEFLHYLFTQPALTQGRLPPVIKARPPTRNTPVAQLARWLGDRLGLAETETIAAPADLAERVHVALGEQQLCFVLDAVSERVAGGVAAFQKEFWRPFYTALRARQQADPQPHRLAAIIVDYTDPPAPGSAAICPSNQAIEALDFAKLLALPPLAPFEKSDFSAWFTALNIPQNRRRSLFEDLRALAPIPDSVFNYLRRENLWHA